MARTWDRPDEQGGITLRMLAQQVGVEPQTVRRWRIEHKIEAYQDPEGVWRIRPELVDPILIARAHAWQESHWEERTAAARRNSAMRRLRDELADCRTENERLKRIIDKLTAAS